MGSSSKTKAIFRTPIEIKAWLRDRAAQNSRSMNAELNHILRSAMEAEPNGEEK